MALSVFSKHCIITTSFLLAVCLVFVVGGFLKESEHNSSEEYYGGYLIFFLGDIFAVLIWMTAISCILMIIGIVKRNLLLMVPWFLLVVAVGIFVCFEGFMLTLYGLSILNIIEFISLVIPAAIFVFLHPYFAVCLEIHRERSVKVKSVGRV